MKLREPVNAITHLIGGAFGILGTILLLVKALGNSKSETLIIGLLVFGLSMVALYFTSGIYHSVLGPKERILFMKKLDHSMIFVLIAGTYTPILLGVTNGRFRITMMLVIWILALSGILFRIFWINAPRWLYTSTYLIMGWISVIVIRNIYSYGGLRPVILLVAGGIFYSVGAVIYALKKPQINDLFGFHEIFHLFIIAGTLMHFLMIYLYLA